MLRWDKSVAPMPTASTQASALRVPVKGGDTDRNHLAYTDDGAIHCFAGCNYYAIIDGFYQKPTLTVDGVSIEGTYVLHPAEEEGS